MLSSEQVVHWFVIPTLMCGVVIGSDAIQWFRGRVNVFDPVGILGLVGILFFFLAPLFHVYWDYWMTSPTPPDDWRDWLGGMAVLNLFGLLVYRWVRTSSRLKRHDRNKDSIWLIDQRKFLTYIPLALVVTGVLQVWVYVSMGGVFGYMSAYAEGSGSFRGMGWVFMISESFPILTLMGFAVYVRNKGMRCGWRTIVGILLAYLCLRFLFGGLRGSRSNTVWGIFWAVGIIHFWIRPIPRKVMLCGIAFLLSFMYLYGFYKSLGVEALDAFRGSEDVASLATETGRTLEATILGDLARSDVQALLLFRLLSPDEYQFGKGRTYLGAAALLIPRSIWPDRPPGKAKEGTDAQYGSGAYVPEQFQSSRVYGLAGEAMLNFGAFSVPLVFGLLGILVGRVRHLLVALPENDARLLLYPLLVNLCFVLLVSDSDNVVFFLVKNGAIPLLLVFLSSKVRRVATQPVRQTRTLQVSAVGL